MKNFLSVGFILFGLVSSAVWAGNDIHVKKGEVWRVSPSQASLTLDTLTLEDGSRIEFDPGIKLWQLTAEMVRIGKNVVIDGSGRKGADGLAGTPAPSAGECQNGPRGGNGAPGEPGSEGITMVLNLGVHQLGSLKIDTQGGEGGRGGDGTPGRNGGELSGCDITHGGDGGDGGRGGDGGNGGLVHLNVALKGQGLSLDYIKQRVALQSEGGRGGEGGKGAPGGEGSPGRFITMKTLSGNKQWVAGGQSGKAGADGARGQMGRPGVVEFNEDLKPRLNAMLEAGSRQMQTLNADLAGQKNAQALNAAVLSLQETVKALQAQVKALQAQLNEQRSVQEKEKIAFNEKQQQVAQQIDALKKLINTSDKKE